MDKQLDELNNKRVENTKKRVAHAVMILDDMIAKLKALDKATDSNKKKSDDATHAITNGIMSSAGKAMSLLIVANEEMEFACKHFDWNDDIVFSIDEVVSAFASAIAPLAYNSELDALELACTLEDVKCKLAHALACLLVWFDDDVRVENV